MWGQRTKLLNDSHVRSWDIFVNLLIQARFFFFFYFSRSSVCLRCNECDWWNECDSIRAWNPYPIPHTAYTKIPKWTFEKYKDQYSMFKFVCVRISLLVLLHNFSTMLISSQSHLIIQQIIDYFFVKTISDQYLLLCLHTLYHLPFAIPHCVGLFVC